MCACFVAVSLSAVSALSLDGEEMTKFEKTYPAAEARVKHRRFNLDKGFTEDGADQEGEEAHFWLPG